MVAAAAEGWLIATADKGRLRRDVADVSIGKHCYKDALDWSEGDGWGEIL